MFGFLWRFLKKLSFLWSLVKNIIKFICLFYLSYMLTCIIYYILWTISCVALGCFLWRLLRKPISLTEETFWIFMYHVNHDHVYSRLSCYFLIYTKKIHCYHFIYKEECLCSRLYPDKSICYLFCSSMKDTWTCLTRCRFYTRCARHCIIFVMTFWNVQHSISEQIKVVVIVLTILLFFFH